MLTLTTNAQLTVNATGNWNQSILASNLPEAGTNFRDTYSSYSNQVMVDVIWQQKSKYDWRVDVRKSDISWHANLLLYTRRTGDGNGQKSQFTYGGTTYFLLTSSNQFFFQGERDGYDIPIQFQITGVSVLIPAQTYSTNIIFTVTEI